MFISLRVGRFSIFLGRDRIRWLGWWWASCYYNIVGSITIATFELGFELVRKGWKWGLPKKTNSWSLYKGDFSKK